MACCVSYPHRFFISSTLALALLQVGCTPSPEPAATSPTTEIISASVNPSKWQLVWHDEFDGDAVNTHNWSFEQNCFGGGNDELQCYTDRPENHQVADGVLTLIARQESFEGFAQHEDSANFDSSQRRTQPYTSARLRSKSKADFRYGRFEIRAKLPHGQGSWPAIWMLPSHWHYGAWAASGEIDIMEAVNLGTPSDAADAKPGQLETRVHGTLHYGGPAPRNVYHGQPYQLPEHQSPADDFHVYALEWEQGEIRWYVDDVHYATQRAAPQHSATPNTAAQNQTEQKDSNRGWYNHYQGAQGQWHRGAADAPFDQPFHLLLNLAVGGNWPANVNNKGVDPQIWPQHFDIDYVRVFRCRADSDTGRGCASRQTGAVAVPGAIPPPLPTTAGAPLT